MERAIQKTDDDATLSKLSAVSKGYYEDKYLAKFCSRAATRRLPLINIGTYCRVKSIDQLVHRFLQATTNATQRAIVSLGAGSDTRAFHLLPQHANLHYYELDYPTKTRQKQGTIAADAELQSWIAQFGARYHLIGLDLREIDAYAGTDLPQSVPTLVLSECCLCYLKPHDSDRVLQFWAEQTAPAQLSVVMYEPISLNDEFGRVMTENLALRGLSLPTINLYATLDLQKQRLATLTRGSADAVDIWEVYTQWLDAADKMRVSSLEFLDEVEEMELLLRHYCVAWSDTPENR